MNLWEYAATQDGQETQQAQEVDGLVQLQRAQERRTDEQERALEICREYQANTRRSEAAQTAILKGLQSGGNPYRLLLTACECIGSLTSNKAFSEMARADIKAIHGVGLAEPEALEMELEDIQTRLAMLTRTELDTEPDDSRRRIDSAIRAHRKRQTEIVSFLECCRYATSGDCPHQEDKTAV